MVKSVRKDLDYFEGLLRRQRENAAERDHVSQKVQMLNDKDVVISSLDSLATHLKDTYQMDKKPWYLASILKEDLGMRYRSIKASSMNTNSERNLVLR